MLAAVLAAVLGVVVLGSSGVARAQPPPTPPPNPSDAQLAAGHDAISQRAVRVATLTGRLSSLDDQAGAIRLELSGRQEQANRALVDQQTAQATADAASAAAVDARTATSGASGAVDALRARVDAFVSGQYTNGLDLGPLGLLTAPGGPQGVLDRAAFVDIIAAEQQEALDGLQRALVDKVNADSLARQAQDAAAADAAAAKRASTAAAAVVARVQGQAAAQAAQLAQVQSQHDAVNRQLDAAVADDAGLRAQRARFVSWQQQQEELARARALAAQRAAAASLAGRPGSSGPAAGSRSVQTVINRAMSELGVAYSWGGGNARGPTTGVHDFGVADSFGDYRHSGFDCSGLMIYAFAGAGISLPHYSGYQYTAGTQVPVAARRPGDMVFYSEDGAIGHVALYVGNGMMVEAPYSGASVRLVPLRSAGLMPYATRML